MRYCGRLRFAAAIGFLFVAFGFSGGALGWALARTPARISTCPPIEMFQNSTLVFVPILMSGAGVVFAALAISTSLRWMSESLNLPRRSLLAMCCLARFKFSYNCWSLISSRTSNSESSSASVHSRLFDAMILNVERPRDAIGNTK